MSIRSRPLVRGAVVAFATAVAAAVVGAISLTGAEAAVNSSRSYLVVYNNNVENLLPASCGASWERLVSYIRRQALSPDIFTVQQISNQKQLDALLKRLSDALPGTYAGKIALANPGSMGYGNSPDACLRAKNLQTNAVIYRSDRFTYEDIARWQSDAPVNKTGPCRNHHQDRVHNVAIRLHDRVTRQDVSVASIHWATGKWKGPRCAGENIKEANEALDRLGGTLKIIGGDANAEPDDAGWWNKAKGYGYRDPIAEQCRSRNCSAAYDTNGKRRIDFLLVKSGHGFQSPATITSTMTSGKYSDHRAVRAYVKY